MKQYVGISRDHSLSMTNVAEAARKDYNNLIAGLKANTIKHGIDTVVSVVECGVNGTEYLNARYDPRNQRRAINRFVVQNSSISAVSPLKEYIPSGYSTPLFDSIDMLIAGLSSVPDFNSPDVSFLVMIVTDGGDNSSYLTGRDLALKVKRLEETEKWSFVFKVPNGMKSNLVSLGFSPNNILEFDAATERGFEASTVSTVQAVDNFYVTRSSGLRSTKAFYIGTDQLNTGTVRRELTNVSKKIKVARVAFGENGKQIRDFVEEKIGTYILGTAFYQLTKKEEIQDHKQIILWDKSTGEYYSGSEARALVGLPSQGSVKVVPDSFPQYEIFVQSSSVNRKIVGGTKIIVAKEKF